MTTHADAPKIDLSADDVVPPTGFTASLTVFTAAAMAFLAVFALALAVSAGQQIGRAHV